MRRLISTLQSLHRNERGDDTIKNIMLLVVAALVVIALIAFGNKALRWLNEKWGDIEGSDVTGEE